MSSCRLWAFAIAVATSSVNSAIRVSLSTGRGFARAEAAMTTPHSRSLAMIGAPTAERTPRSRSLAASAPGAAA